MTEYHKVIKIRSGELLVCKCVLQENDEYLRRERITIKNPVLIYSYQMEIGDDIADGFMFRPWIEVTNDTTYTINTENIITVANLNVSLIEKYETFLTKHPQEKINFTSKSESKESDESLLLRSLLHGSDSIN